MTAEPLDGEFHSPPAEHDVLCRCTFTLSDIEDVWAEIVEDDEAELPPVVLQVFLTAAELVDDAMIERGYEAIRSILTAIAAGERP